MNETKTPRTNGAVKVYANEGAGVFISYVEPDFARQLETEVSLLREALGPNVLWALKQSLRQWQAHYDDHNEDDLDTANHIEAIWYRDAQKYTKELEDALTATKGES